MGTDSLRQLERLCKALANRRRLAAIRYLKEHRQATVGEVAAYLRLSISATSRHLSLLALVGVVENEQRGLLVYYRLASERRSLHRQLDTIF